MTLSEADRHALHDHFISQMGEHLAGQLMRELVHGVQWSELATKENVVATRETLRAEMAELRADMGTEIAGLRTEMHGSLRRMTVWMASLQTAIFGAVAALAIRGG